MKPKIKKIPAVNRYLKRRDTDADSSISFFLRGFRWESKNYLSTVSQRIMIFNFAKLLALGGDGRPVVKTSEKLIVINKDATQFNNFVSIRQ